MTAIRLRSDGANPNPQISGADRCHKSDYFIGNDPKKWHTDVRRTVGEICGVYPEWIWFSMATSGGMEYDFVVAPGADRGPSR